MDLIHTMNTQVKQAGSWGTVFLGLTLFTMWILSRAILPLILGVLFFSAVVIGAILFLLLMIS